jgi:hypothetical protein
VSLVPVNSTSVCTLHRYTLVHVYVKGVKSFPQIMNLVLEAAREKSLNSIDVSCAVQPEWSRRTNEETKALIAQMGSKEPSGSFNNEDEVFFSRTTQMLPQPPSKKSRQQGLLWKITWQLEAILKKPARTS